MVVALTKSNLLLYRWMSRVQRPETCLLIMAVAAHSLSQVYKAARVGDRSLCLCIVVDSGMLASFIVGLRAAMHVRGSQPSAGFD